MRIMPLLLLLSAAPGPAAEAPPPLDGRNYVLGLTFEEFFPPAERKPGRRPLPLYVLIRDGKIVHAIASAPTWNKTAHPADASRLAYSPREVKGEIAIPLQCDPWIPRDQKELPCSVTVQATLPDDLSVRSLEGTYRGRCGDQDVKGKMLIRRMAYDASCWRNCTASLQLVDCLVGGEHGYQRRIAVEFDVRDGKLAGQRFGLVGLDNRPFDLRPLERAELDMRQDSFTARVTIPHEDLDAIADADATYHVEIQAGLRMGNMVGGLYRVRVVRPGKEDLIKQRSFKGWLTAPREDQASFWDAELRADRPWWVPVQGHVPVKPNEHPRLFFRKGDLDALRRRSQTPEGKAILARLRATLGGGEDMPAHLSRAKKAYDDSVKEKLPEGAYTLSHAAGFGMLYQLTGQAKYAQLARRCVELALAGQRDRDDRYSFRAPGGELRAGPTLAWYALAYDLCYDAWDADFRRKLALEIQNYDDAKGGEWARPDGVSMRVAARSPQHMPGSNHWGSTLGVGLALLAIVGDDGTDDRLVRGYLQHVEKNLVRNLHSGFGDGGFYAEGPGPSHMAANPAFVPLLQAMRNVLGHDYVNAPRPNAAAVTLHWIYELVPGKEGKPFYPCRKPSSYGSEDFLSGNGGMSHGGWFSQGFGAVPDAAKPALLWTYENLVAAADQNRRDTANYPHRSILALVNWPIGLQARNPADILPRTHVDRMHGWYVFRNRWKDGDDIIVSALFNHGPQGHKSIGGGDALIWGLGARHRMSLPKATTAHYEARQDGSGTVTAGGAGLAVDFDPACGAEALVVRASPEPSKDKPADTPVGKFTTLQAGKYHYVVLTLQKADPPTVRVKGDGIVIGRRELRFDGSRIHTRTASESKPDGPK